MQTIKRSHTESKSSGYANEDQFQAACFEWAWNYLPQTRRLLWHVPNGGARNAKEASKLKAMGVVPGVFDLHLLWHGVLWVIELKVGLNSQSNEQIKWGEAVRAHGAQTYEIRDLEQFQQIMKKIVL